MKKRMFCILLALALCLSALPAAEAAAGDYTGKRDGAWPVPSSASISSCYLDPMGHSGRHYAIDIVGAHYADVVSCFDGEVLRTFSGCTSDKPKSTQKSCPCGVCGDLGNAIYVACEYEGTIFVVRYGHLAEVSVKAGDLVRKGQRIGSVGSTGRSGGYHLDLRIQKQSSGTKLDNSLCVDPLKDQFLEIPAGLNANAASSWCTCCYDYVREVLEIYAESDYISGWCTAYPAGLSLKFRRRCIPYTLPCTEETAAAVGCTSDALYDQEFASRSTCDAIGLYRNSDGEYWYKVILEDGSCGYVDAADTTAQIGNPLRIEDGGFPDCITGPTGLEGILDGGGATLMYVRAYVYPAGSDVPVLMSELDAVNAMQYPLKGSTVDNSLRFGSLAAYGSAEYRLDIVADAQTCYVQDGQVLTEWMSGLIAGSWRFRFGEDGGLDLGTPEPEPEDPGREDPEPEEPGHPEHSPILLPGAFEDVPEDAYYYDAVAWASDMGITNGTGEYTFSPDEECLRSQVVTFLWRAEGCPAPESWDHPFRDLEENSYCYEAVLWALENGITNGVTPTEFGPDEPCTREQVVTFLYRTMGQPRVWGVNCPFRDVEDGAWYEKPVLWAVKHGITMGVSEDCFGAGEICTRAQIVTFLYRAYEE